MIHILKRCQSSLVITDPYLIYKSRVAQGLLRSDPHQIALIKKLSKLSNEIQHYKPNLTNVKINQLVRNLEIRFKELDNINAQQRGEIYKKTIGWYKTKSQEEAIKSLIVKVKDEDELFSIDFTGIPKGLLVNGEVGSGKSLCMDMFADSLPIKGKWRIHQTAFNNWVLKEINIISQNKRIGDIQSNHPLLRAENDMILYQLASNLITKCHVLILDEFMLPDIAMAKITKTLFTYYFRLGGILISSSNRLPAELYSGGVSDTSMDGFERVLKFRCDIWDMNSETDYRTELLNDESHMAEESWLVIGTKGGRQEWDELKSKYLPSPEKDVIVFKNYGRDVKLPCVDGDTVYFDFNDLIHDSAFGPGDFIEIAKRFKLIMIDNVPILTKKMKNQARRLITIIDAIYDERCNLMIKVECEPEELFFPDETKQSQTGKADRFQCTPIEDGPNYLCLAEAGVKPTSGPVEEEMKIKGEVPSAITNVGVEHPQYKKLHGDRDTTEVQDDEMQFLTESDLANPHRPNFASYQELDFDVNKAHADLQERLTTKAKFTGEDELFAFKRAVSRIREMTQSKRWRLMMSKSAL